MGTKSLMIRASLVAVLFCSATAQADAGLPYDFVPDTPALAEEVNANFRYVAPVNVVYVRGDRSPEDNGAALQDAVDPSTLAGLGGAPSAEKPYLIKLHPGTYRLSQPLVLGAHVHLQGAGRGASKIVSSADGDAIDVTQASVRDLSLELAPSSSGLVTGIRLRNGPGSLVSQVWIEGTGQSMRGIWSSTSASDLHRIEHSEIRFQPSSEGVGIGVGGSGRVVVQSATISIDGSASKIIGFTEAGAVTIRAVDLDISLDGRAASGSTEYVWGIENRGGREKRFENTRVWVSSNNADVSYTIHAPTGTGSVLYFENGALLHSFTSHSFLNFAGGNGAIRIAGTKLSSAFFRVRSGSPRVKCVYNYDPEMNSLGNCFDEPI